MDGSAPGSAPIVALGRRDGDVQVVDAERWTTIEAQAESLRKEHDDR